MRRLDSDIIISDDDRIGAPVRRQRRSTADARDAGESKPKAKRKLPRLRLNMRPLQKLATGGVAVTALIVGASVLWHSGVIQHTAQATVNGVLSLTAKAGFRIEEITISGRGRTTTDDIAAALAAPHGSPILGVDLTRVKDRLEAIPSVRIAAVERRLPASLHIAIVERQPIAIWQNNGEHVLVDRDGRLIPGSIAGFEDLPLVVGDGAGARADELLAMLAAEPQLATRVRAAVRVANRRWNIMLDDPLKGLEVRLPEDQPESAWHRLAQLEREHAISARQVSMIDLRTPDRMVLKTERPATPVETIKRKDNGA